MWDVIVVGAGPGGSLAAKRSAEQGFKTLMVEKKKFPRDKVCSGMIAGAWAIDTIAQEFGQISKEILVYPYLLSGQMFHVPGAEPKALKWRTLLAWRKDLDAWMNQKALEKGSEIWDDTKVVAVLAQNGNYTVRVEKENHTVNLETKYVVGADGAGSVVRKSLFPKLKVNYSIPIRECYEGVLDLDPHYLHWFFPHSSPRPRFNINFKGHFFLVEGSGIKNLRKEIAEVLSKYGVDPAKPPVWRDGCRVALLHSQLISGVFSPADGNAMLVGDAAGLLLPISFEGIGTALKSGQFAADAIYESVISGRNAAEIYSPKLNPMVSTINRLYFLDKALATEMDKGPDYLCDALRTAYEDALNIDNSDNLLEKVLTNGLAAK